MPNKCIEFERAKNEFWSEKIAQQNLAYSAIFDYNSGEIDYASCQTIVFNCFQNISRVFITEFVAEKFF